MKPLVKAIPYLRKEVKHKEIVKNFMPHQETFKNDIYTVFVSRNLPIDLFIDNNEQILITHLSIKRNDNKAVIDWRHFQWIKNQICGDEAEGIELYPAESRMVDGANQFHIWVIENKGFIFPLGFSERMVTQKKFFGETQRKFPLDRIPTDLAECELKLDNQIKELNLKL